MKDSIQNPCIKVTYNIHGHMEANLKKLKELSKFSPYTNISKVRIILHLYLLVQTNGLP